MSDASQILCTCRQPGKEGASENNRKVKNYRLTAAGRRKLQREAEKWNCMADVIAGILQSKPGDV